MGLLFVLSKISPSILKMVLLAPAPVRLISRGVGPEKILIVGSSFKIK
jgi:hypothetical protein